LAFTGFPNRLVYLNQFSGRLSIDGGFIRRFSGGMADWTELFGEGVIVARRKDLSRKFRPMRTFKLF